MLSELYINHLAVIEKTNVEFEGGFNVFTGETGAGKSIVIDAINAVLGQRVSRELVRNGEKKAVISAVFTELTPSLQEKLSAFGYETEDGTLMIQREISADGKTIARIGGAPVTAAVLKEIGSSLINIHGQHDNQTLLQPEKHLSILDAFGELDSTLAAYQEHYQTLLRIHRERKAIDLDEEKKAKQIDLLSYQIQEIKDANLKIGEEEQLENDKIAAQNYSKIMDSLQASYLALFGENDTGGALDQIAAAKEGLADAALYDANIAEISEKFSETSYQLEDIAGEISRLFRDSEYDPMALEKLEERLNLYYQLKKKYGGSVEAVLNYQRTAEEKLEQIKLSEERSALLQQEEEDALIKTREAAEILTEKRKKAAEKLIARITEELRFLDMPNVSMDIQFQKDKMRLYGRDIVEFLISSNPGEPPKPIAKIASGGELSRIMLAIKNALADKDDIPTLIFDEVDTGVSGKAAQKIGLKLKSVAKHRQIICVTHLAQIAALADSHFLIRKDFSDQKTFTQVYKLDFEGRKQEIARIIGTDQITELTLQNAEEMIIQGTEKKQYHNSPAGGI